MIRSLVIGSVARGEKVCGGRVGRVMHPLILRGVIFASWTHTTAPTGSS